MKAQKNLPPQPCTVCGELFQPYRQGNLYCKSYECKRTVLNESWRKWRDSDEGNRVKIKEYRDQYRANGGPRRTELLRKYNLTVAEYERLLSITGVCQICQTNREPLVVDHDHDTGEVRGVLCRRCNRSIGQLGDSQEAIEKVLQYFMESSSFMKSFRASNSRDS